MAFDLKKTIEEVVEKLMADKSLLTKFQRDPISVVEKLVGVDLPNEMLEPLVDGVKARIDLGKVGDLLGGLSSLGGMFGKK